jgi:preprotein translocase subunit SecG
MADENVKRVLNRLFVALTTLFAAYLLFVYPMQKQHGQSRSKELNRSVQNGVGDGN